MGINLNEIGMRKVNIGSTEIYKIYKGSTLIWPTLPTPISRFSGTPTRLIEGNTVSYTDESTSDATGWDWVLQGGTPGTSSSQNPTITYNTAGTYDATLTADNANGDGNTVVKTDYITVVEQEDSAGDARDPFNWPYTNGANAILNGFSWASGSTNATIINDYPNDYIRVPNCAHSMTVTVDVEGGDGTYSASLFYYDGVDGNYLGSDALAIHIGSSGSTPNYESFDFSNTDINWVYIKPVATTVARGSSAYNGNFRIQFTD